MAGCGASANFTYDVYGNLLERAVAGSDPTVYAYDPADRLVGFTPDGGDPVTYSLDAAGRRWTRSVDGILDATYAYHAATNQVSRIVSGALTTDAAFDAAGTRLATATSASGFGWLLADLHGNAAATAADDFSSIDNAFRYDPYGQLIDSVTDSLPTPWRFGGRLHLDPGGATDLYDWQARTYDPGLGAFTSLDSVTGSVESPLTLNRYLFTHANPVSLIDTDGHSVDGGIGNCVPSCPTVPAPPRPGPNGPGKPKGPTVPAMIDTLPAYSGGSTKEADKIVTMPADPGYTGSCSVQFLNCTPTQFEAMSAKSRLAWVQAVERRMEVEDWYNAIEDILTFADQQDLIRAGSWFSIVDAHILIAIQDGAALSRRMGRPGAAGTPGAAEWSTFFNSVARAESAEASLLQAWGTAEQTATDHGVRMAEEAGVAAPPNEFFVGIAMGNMWRGQVRDAAAREAQAAARDEFGWSLPYAGLVFGIVEEPVNYVFDPRNHGPAYWSATALYTAVSVDPPLPPLPGLQIWDFLTP